MSPEGYELIRAFLRRWSTIELDEDVRLHLKQDALRTKALLKVYEDSFELVDDAVHAPDRHWFAEKFRSLYMGELEGTKEAENSSLRK